MCSVAWKASVNEEKLDKIYHSMFDVMVFDEICFHNSFALAKVKDFVEQHRANKVILATGDATPRSMNKLRSIKVNRMSLMLATS